MGCAAEESRDDEHARAPVNYDVSACGLASRHLQLPRTPLRALVVTEVANDVGESSASEPGPASESCRWTTKDRSRFDGGLNLYEYADSDPANRIDPSGFGPFDFARCLMNRGSFRQCVDEERDRFDHGPLGDCKNCGVPPGPGGGGPPGRDPRDREVIREACTQQAVWRFKECLKAGRGAECLSEYGKNVRRCLENAGLACEAFDPLTLPILPLGPVPVPL